MTDNLNTNSTNDNNLGAVASDLQVDQVQGSSSTMGIIDKTKEFLEKQKSQQQDISDTTSSTITKKDVSIKGMSNILDALLAKEKITLEQYNNLKFESINTGKSIEELIKLHKIANSEEITRTYSEMSGTGFADLKSMVIDIDTLNLIPADIAGSNQAIAFESLPNKVKVAMKDPLDLQKLKYLESIVGKRIEPFYGTEEDINYIIDTKYGAQIGEEVSEAMQEVGGEILDIKKTAGIGQQADTEADTAPVIKIVNMVLDYGVKNKASDIHIEPRENEVVVRFRIRGILHEKLTIPKQLHSAVVSRIKILSDLKIDEHRVPQDGRFQIKTGRRLVDVRVSVMPSIYGEKIVMRLLEKSKGIMDLEATGIRGISYERLSRSLKKTQGIILVTGPTGSGKTQTLASSLKILNNPEVNIMTLEDPVEIRIDGVTQVQVNPEVGLTFATGLRSFLRQDPDIIMVGEIRDSETANLAVQSALVGRLVMATLHTNSSAGAFARLLDMGVEPFLLASTVNVVMAQRLVRTLCENCKEAYEPTAEVMASLHGELDSLNGIDITKSTGEQVHFDQNTNKVTLYKPVGCPKCGDSGYGGRTGIFECLDLTEDMASLVMKKAPIGKIHEQAVSDGMITMAQDGMIKVLEGITTIEEVLRVRNE